ncbi:MAG: hypothetical protein ACLPXW_09455 [Xanthobacteraceae bacterium]
MTKLQSVLLATATFALGGAAVSALHAQSNAPYYEVAGINVTDQAGYEASGVVQLRDTIKASGAKLIAGGYNKATVYEGDITAPNRFLIFMYPSKEIHDKVWANDIKPWVEKVKGKYVDRFRVFGVEAVEQK